MSNTTEQARQGALQVAEEVLDWYKTVDNDKADRALQIVRQALALPTAAPIMELGESLTLEQLDELWGRYPEVRDYLNRKLREKTDAHAAAPAPAVPDDVADLLCSVTDNLGDMPVSEEWAARTSNAAYGLIVKYRLLATPAAQSQEHVNRPQNCGTSYCSCIECVCEPTQEPVTLADEVFEALELDPESFRTDGGAVNTGKLKAAILHPYNYLPPDHWLQARFSKPGGRPLATDARKPLTEIEMEKGREQLFSTNNPYCPCDRKTFKKVAEWVERHHGIAALREKEGK